METKMKSCLKCTSDNIFVRQGGIGWGIKLMVSGVGFGMQSTDDWETYVCADCGYFENYLTKKDWLAKIQTNSKWRKAE